MTQSRSLHRDTTVAVIGLLGLALWDSSGLDLALARSFGDAGGFAWRDHWLTTALLHEGGRAAGWLVLGVLIVGIWWPLPFARSLQRADRIWWVSATLACLLVVSLAKRFSLSSCPWSLAEFGGSAQWMSHWAWGAADGGPGHCFPSGHASAAFAFFTGWFVLREHNPRAARIWLSAVLAAGVAFGVGQLMRGAHYPSHTLWTAWICWCVAALGWAVRRRQKSVACPAAPGRLNEP